MARNGSGTMTIPNSFVSGNTITASGHNQNNTDIASEITNSVAADGQTSMTGPLKGVNGTAAAPTHTFASDPNTGTYRHGADELGFTVGGVLAGWFDSAKKLWAIGAVDVAGLLTVTGGATLSSTLGVTGNFAVNTNKFTVAAASGNTLAAGTMDVTGNFAVNTNKFTVTASSGDTLAAGTLSATGNFAINTNKFNVTAASGNTTIAGTLDVTGAAGFTAAVSGASSILSSSASAGVGYKTGAGGAVTQITSKSTGVTLNTICGQITTHNASLAGSFTTVQFTFTNSAIGATDTVLLTLATGAVTPSSYFILASGVVAGSCKIGITNGGGGALAEALVINFAVIKAVAS